MTSKFEVTFEGIIGNSEIKSISFPEQYKYVCKIKIKEVDSNNISYGTGTLIKIKKNDRYFYFLISNEHVIEDCMINSNYILIITYYSTKNSRKKAKITLNKEERIIKSYKNNLDIDATIVQIIPEDNINDEYFYHFNTTFNNFLELENKFIYIFQYPGYQKKLKYSEGEIINSDNNNYCFKHSASTEPGSSGSPIFCSVYGKYCLIGIHSAYLSKESCNIGYFIEPIINDLKTEKYTYKNGFTYYGPLSKGRPNGKGKIFDKNKNLFYSGDIKFGKAEGYGIRYYSNGNKHFKGNFSKGHFVDGILYNNRGKKIYNGKFKDDKFDGFGIQYNENGEVTYKGPFKENLRHGAGTFYDKSGIKRDGIFHENSLERIFLDEKYKSNNKKFKATVLTGKGKAYEENGYNVLEGIFINGIIEGKGVEYFKDKSYYLGEFKKGIKDGKGIICDPDGKILIQGFFFDGSLYKEADIEI